MQAIIAACAVTLILGFAGGWSFAHFTLTRECSLLGAFTFEGVAFKCEVRQK